MAGKKIGPGQPCFIIAVAGVNHNGKLDLALRLVDAAAAIGADAVKFQTFRAQEVISPLAPMADYQRANTGTDESQLTMAKRLELSPAEHRRVFEHCRERGILYLSSPFDNASVSLLDEMGVEGFKVGSGELTNSDLLANVAKRKRPILLSTGMGTFPEICDAVGVIQSNGNPPFCLFHCVSSYPAPPSECCLAVIDSLRKAFGVPVGWSDHTLGIHISLAAVARGANLLEKHLTLDRNLPGPDHVASMEPNAFREMVKAAREIEAAIGEEYKRLQPSERNTAAVARRSIHIAVDMPAGHNIRREDLVLLRPGNGIPPSQLARIVGRRIGQPMLAGTILKYEDLE
jgi:N-acetylneuraminate synthase